MWLLGPATPRKAAKTGRSRGVRSIGRVLGMSYIQTFVSIVSFMWMGHRRSIHLETTKHRKTKAIGITLQGQPKYEPKMPYQ